MPISPRNRDSLLKANPYLCLRDPDSLLRISFWPWGSDSLLRVPLTSRSTPFSKSSHYPWGLDSILEARFSLKVLIPSLRWIPTCVSKILTPSSGHLYLWGPDSLLELLLPLRPWLPLRAIIVFQVMNSSSTTSYLQFLIPSSSRYLGLARFLSMLLDGKPISSWYLSCNVSKFVSPPEKDPP